MKTAMEELIEFISSANVFNQTHDGRRNEYAILSKAKDLLEKEKKQIVDAVNKTDKDACTIANKINEGLFNHDSKIGEKYYNENFNEPR